MTMRFPLAWAVALALLIWGAAPLAAEEFQLPDPAELQTFSRDAMPFYISGIAALDRADYGNAYSALAKAAQLQPNAARLNRIVAALAMKLGRSKPAAEARGYYETAIVSFENILRDQTLDEDFRRDVFNRLKVARDERDNLEQRDARRESIGAFFIQELNRSYVEEARKKDQAKESPTPAPAAGQPLPPGATPLPVGGYPGAAPVVPGVPTPAYPSTVPTPAPAGGLPAYPGGVPGYPTTDPGAAPVPPVPAPLPGPPSGQPI